MIRSSFAAFLLFLVAAAVGCAGKPPSWVPADVKLADRVEVPVDLPAHGLPVVTVARSTANDEGKVTPTLAIIDTGAAVSIVTSKYAEARALQVRNVGDLRMRDAFNKEAKTAEVARLKTLTLGQTRIEESGATFEDFDAIVRDFESMTQLSDKLDLLLGREVFRGVLLTIDYPKRKLIIELGELPEPNGRDVLPLKRNESGQLLIPVTLMNEEAWMILDTGYTGDGLSLSRYRLLGVPWAATPVEGDEVRGFLGTSRSRVGRMDADVQLGHYTFRKPILAVSYDDDNEYLGADFLRHFAVTIDQKNDRVRLTRLTTKPIDTPAVARMGFNFVDKDGKVEVIDGSEAQKAGLQTDDVVRAINGVSSDRFTYLHRDAQERKSEPMLVRFTRDGQEMIQRVPMTVIVP